MEDKAQKVLAAMKKVGKPVKPGELAEQLGLDSKEISKIIDGLKKSVDDLNQVPDIVMQIQADPGSFCFLKCDNSPGRCKLLMF